MVSESHALWAQPTMPYYAVKVGKVPGVYNTWAEASAQVTGFPAAVHAKFATHLEAESFVTSKENTSHSNKSASVNRNLPQVPSNTRSIFLNCATEGLCVPTPSSAASTMIPKTLTTMQSIPTEEAIYLYTDGACHGNYNVHSRECPAGWGVCIVRRSTMAVLAELHGPVVLQPQSPFYLGATVGSNNSAELSAVGEALLWLRDYSGSVLGEPKPGQAPLSVCVRYDSEYAAKSVQGIYNGKKNEALIARIRSIYQEVLTMRAGPQAATAIARGVRLGTGLAGVQWEHVRGHSNELFNSRADELAGMGARGLVCTEGRYSKTDSSVVTGSASVSTATLVPNNGLFSASATKKRERERDTFEPRAKPLDSRKLDSRSVDRDILSIFSDSDDDIA